MDANIRLSVLLRNIVSGILSKNIAIYLHFFRKNATFATS